MSGVAERLRQELAEVSWRELRSHVARDTVIVVGPELDLVAAAAAVARDDSAQIGAWIGAGEVAKPTIEQLACWEKDLEKPFRMLIVGPYILAQPVLHG
ncbi:MAG: DUF2288 family protein [Deltaproteobacteria bacterium]|nr:DUF2288 family protein [Deltaproteobacteria bacterium]